MIKNFETYINEDYFSKLANRKDNGNVRKENDVTEDLVMSYCNNKYKHHVNSISFRKENGKYFVDIDGCFCLGNDVEEIPFQFGTVTGYFDCSETKLKTLEGCPNKVGGGFYCNDCKNLISLNGCPKEVGGDFNCACCINLASLEGCPKEVCGDFNCVGCENLTSLNGCPQEVGYNFVCHHCGKEFTEEEVKSLCDVKGKIFV